MAPCRNCPPILAMLPAILRLVPIGCLFLMAQSLGAQCSATQTRDCNLQCGPTGDVTKQEYNTCMSECTKKCPVKPAPSCFNGSGGIFPQYYVLGILYAPPGCTSTPSLKCAAESSVDYFSGSSMGTKVSTTSDFAINLTTSTSMSVLNFMNFASNANFSATATDSNSETITKGTTFEIKAPGSGDGVDHTQDQFILLLNPAIAVSETTPVVNNGCGNTSGEWYMGLRGSGTENLYQVSVSWLQNPSTMPPDVTQQLKTLGFTPAAYQTILNLDPFAAAGANPQTVVASNSSRYLPTLFSFPYEPPLQATDCNNGVCSCASFSEGVQNALATDAGSGFKTSYTVGTSTSATLPVNEYVNITFGGNAGFTYTTSSTTDNLTNSSQTATASITCPSPNYSGPTNMMIYFDDLYGTFVMVPTVLSSPGVEILHRGVVLDAAGKPMRHVAVTVVVAGKTYHTWTGNTGDYAFLIPATLRQSVTAATGQLTIQGLTQQVSLFTQQPLRVKIP